MTRVGERPPGAERMLALGAALRSSCRRFCIGVGRHAGPIPPRARHHEERPTVRRRGRIFARPLRHHRLRCLLLRAHARLPARAAAPRRQAAPRARAVAEGALRHQGALCDQPPRGGARAAAVGGAADAAVAGAPRVGSPAAAAAAAANLLAQTKSPPAAAAGGVYLSASRTHVLKLCRWRRGRRRPSSGRSPPSLRCSATTRTLSTSRT